MSTIFFATVLIDGRKRWGHWDLNPDKRVSPTFERNSGPIGSGSFTGHRSSQSSRSGRPRPSADPFPIILVTGARCATWLHHAPGNGLTVPLEIEGFGFNSFSTSASWLLSFCGASSSSATSSAYCLSFSRPLSPASFVSLLCFVREWRTRGDSNPRHPA